MRGDDARRFETFAARLNRLSSLLDGTHLYAWKAEFVAPKIEACICPPMAIPLAKPDRDRMMLVAYLFVQGLPVTSWDQKVFNPGNYEERRHWINGIVGDVLPAYCAGELPAY